MSGRRFGPEVGYSCADIDEGDSTPVWRPLCIVIARRICGPRKVVFLEHDLPVLGGDSHPDHFSILPCGWKRYETPVGADHWSPKGCPVRHANWRTTRNWNLEDVRRSTRNLTKVEDQIACAPTLRT